MVTAEFNAWLKGELVLTHTDPQSANDGCIIKSMMNGNLEVKVPSKYYLCSMPGTLNNCYHFAKALCVFLSNVMEGEWANWWYIGYELWARMVTKGNGQDRISPALE